MLANAERSSALPTKEHWRTIKGYTKYQISDRGRVYSIKSKIYLKPIICDRYQQVDLYEKGHIKRFFIHRLVAVAFVLNLDSKPIVNHIDCNKLHNAAANLEWSTHHENMAHGVMHHRFKGSKGSSNNQAKLSNKEVFEIKKLLKEGNLLQREIGAMFCVTQPTISRIKTGRIWSHLNV